jgi:AcrR family transcriptional regulator
VKKENCLCRDKIFDAALRIFAQRGYSGASLQEIVSAAHLTKPTLYYYFKSKDGLFNALLEDACNEYFQRLQSGAARATGVEQQLVEMLASVFEFFRERRELTRLAFASAFAAPGEMPVKSDIQQKRKRNFGLVHGVIKKGLADGTLDAKLDSRELAYGIYGALSFHIMANVLLPGTPLNRTTAQGIVRLFMDGARKRAPIPSRKKKLISAKA